ncbi:hypothetical protein M5689_010521 [Euphorbia peplus]|nr:hypothetical protein M5689_010521 [Euphorbia peplus]
MKNLSIYVIVLALFITMAREPTMVNGKECSGPLPEKRDICDATDCDDDCIFTFGAGSKGKCNGKACDCTYSC